MVTTDSWPGEALKIAWVLEVQLLQPIGLALLYREGEGVLKVELGEEYYEKGEVSIAP